MSNTQDLYYANTHHDAVDSYDVHDFVEKCYDDGVITGDDCATLGDDCATPEALLAERQAQVRTCALQHLNNWFATPSARLRRYAQCRYLM